MTEVFKHKQAQITEEELKAAYAVGSARYRQVADAWEATHAAYEAQGAVYEQAREKAVSAAKRAADWFSAYAARNGRFTEAETAAMKAAADAAVIAAVAYDAALEPMQAAEQDAMANEDEFYAFWVKGE